MFFYSNNARFPNVITTSICRGTKIKYDTNYINMLMK